MSLFLAYGATYQFIRFSLAVMVREPSAPALQLTVTCTRASISSTIPEMSAVRVKPVFVHPELVRCPKRPQSGLCVHAAGSLPAVYCQTAQSQLEGPHLRIRWPACGAVGSTPHPPVPRQSLNPCSQLRPASASVSRTLRRYSIASCAR